MSAAPIGIARAAIGDEATLRDVRLRALRDTPDAFGSTLERELGRTDADWQRWFSPGVTFIAHDAAGAVGLVAGSHDPEDASIIHLMAMWVDPAHRGGGAGDALVTALLSWAAEERAREIRLLVVSTNARARRFYERHGFRATGEQKTRPRDGAAETVMARPAAVPAQPGHPAASGNEQGPASV